MYRTIKNLNELISASTEAQASVEILWAEATQSVFHGEQMLVLKKHPIRVEVVAIATTPTRGFEHPDWVFKGGHALLIEGVMPSEESEDLEDQSVLQLRNQVLDWFQYLEEDPYNEEPPSPEQMARREAFGLGDWIKT